MIRIISRYILAVAAFLLCTAFSKAQNDPIPDKDIPAITKKSPKPFKILTSGKRITVQSINANNNLKQILVWTSSGNRIVEQHDLDVPTYAFNIPVNEKIFFVLLEMKDGSRHTEKIGIR